MIGSEVSLMITQKTTLVDISKEKSLRYDVDYIKFHQTHVNNYLSFDDLFSIAPSRTCTEDELYRDFLYCEIGDSDKDGGISPVALNFEDRNLENENYYKKIENGDIMPVDLDDILISKVRPNLKKYVRITEDKRDVYFTTAFIKLKAKEMPSVLYYCLRSVFYSDLMAIARQGKGYPTISEKDLHTLRFDETIVEKLRANYESIREEIVKIEQRIAEKASSIMPMQGIIDTAFQREFNFDYERFNELKSEKHYTSHQSFFSNNPDLRFSAKFHRPAGEFVMEQLTGITNKKIKHYISEPIVLGASVSPSDYDENGEYYYISMATIKTWEFDESSASLVSDRYSAERTAKTVQKDDIILARSGEGTIGKVAIISDDTNGIFADFTMRIRLNTDIYNPTFAYYYMRSCYFQYLVEIYKKGLGNNTNIFPAVIQEFPIPDISIDEQQRIVDEIQSEMVEQDNIRAEIAALRSQIDSIIEKTII